MPSRDRRKSPRGGDRGKAHPRIEILEVRTVLSGGSNPSAEQVVTTLAEAASSTDAEPLALATTTTASSTDAEPLALSTTATATSTPAPETASPPDLIAARLAGPSNLDWDQEFRLEGSILNQGGSIADSAFRVDVFASPTTKTNRDSVPIGSFLVPAGLAPGQRYDFDVPLRTPGRPTAPLAGQPSYYLTLKVDAANAIAESNETNNANLGLQGVDAAMVTYTPRLPAKLVAAGLAVRPTQADWGGSIEVTATLRNDGPGKAPPTNARIVLAPFGEDPQGPRSYTIGFVPMPEIQGYQTVTASQTIDLPDHPPTALANVAKFALVLIADADGLTDPVIKPASYQGIGRDWTTLNLTPRPAANQRDTLPDLAITALTTPATIAWDQTIEVHAKLENVGTRDAGPFRLRFGLVQSDAPNAPMLALADAFLPGLAAGHIQDVLQTIKLPASIPAGMNPNALSGRLVARIDPDRALDETRTDNNRLTSPPITLRVVQPDGSASAPITITAPPIPPNSTPTPPAQPTLPRDSSQPQPAQPSQPARRPSPPVVLPIRRRPTPPRRLHPPQANNRPHLRIFPRPKRQAAPPTPLLAGGRMRIMPFRPNGPGRDTPNQPA
ncbi:MAG: hypothetical protein KatS3mg108_3857 [Isosphaeraceae bacterium]|jgi:hypothetical protein|nr:MAG: hypothetical protein KatS3mg108_3857 [Isosphaeraceae bacterium]